MTSNLDIVNRDMYMRFLIGSVMSPINQPREADIYRASVLNDKEHVGRGLAVETERRLDETHVYRGRVVEAVIVYQRYHR